MNPSFTGRDAPVGNQAGFSLSLSADSSCGPRAGAEVFRMQHPRTAGPERGRARGLGRGLPGECRAAVVSCTLSLGTLLFPMLTVICCSFQGENRSPNNLTHLSTITTSCLAGQWDFNAVGP